MYKNILVGPAQAVDLGAGRAGECVWPGTDSECDHGLASAGAGWDHVEQGSRRGEIVYGLGARRGQETQGLDTRGGDCRCMGGLGSVHRAMLQAWELGGSKASAVVPSLFGAGEQAQWIGKWW
ncbi:hypothetical protein FIBSPDRAFT_892172 [Athelia psychrophila]|uniref:Uncharacterized protein n=1 Tax=Athelia psychrophila TaxID=1759441 RepID=A0A166IVU3_9AGAM|nr:hypothetical protein FIBSPDRAFT_892172 [Fibularhizoctonia sp. CBS 109695]